MIEFVVALKDLITGPAKAASGSIDGLAKQVRSLADATGEGAGGPLGTLAEGLDGIAGPAAIAVTAVAAVGAAFAGLVASGAALALQQTELKEKLISTFDALGNGSGAGEKTLKMLDGLSDRIGLTRAQLAPMAQQMMAIGITSGPALEKAVLASASAFALYGDKGVAAFQKVMKSSALFLADAGKMKNPLKAFSDMGLGEGQSVAAAMGIDVKTLAAQIKAGTVDAKKFGDAIQDALIKKGSGPLATMGASLSAQWDKFRENIGKLFEDVDVAPFLGAMKDLLGVFSQGTASGKTLKAGITGFFNSLFAAAAKVLPVVKNLFLTLVTLGLKAYIAAKPLVATFKEWLPALTPIWTALKFIAGVVIDLGLVAAASLAIVVGPFIAMGAAALWLVGVVAGGVDDIAGALSGLVKGAEDAAANFITGLVDGITGGISRVIGAAKDLAGSALDAVKSTLGIASPSKVMMQLGGHTAGGFASGIEGGSGAVAGAAGGMGGGAKDAAYAASSYGGGGGKGGGGGGVVVNVGGITIEGAGKGAEDLTEEAVSLIFERVALSQGLG